MSGGAAGAGFLTPPRGGGGGAAAAPGTPVTPGWFTGVAPAFCPCMHNPPCLPWGGSHRQGRHK